MAMANIINEVWADEIVTLLETNLLARQFVNTNIVQGKGGSWHIIGMGDVPSPSDYSDSVDITYGEASDTKTTLNIDKDQIIPLIIYDTQIAESKYAWQPIMARRIGYKLQDAIDEDVWSHHASAGQNFDEAGTDWQFTKDTCAEIPSFFAQLTKDANDLDWPTMGRYFVAPSGFLEAMTVYFANRATQLGDSVIVGNTQVFNNVMGWDVGISNNLTTVSTTTHGIAGIRGDGIALKEIFSPDDLESKRAQSRKATLLDARARWGVSFYDTTKIIDIEFNSTVVAT